MKKTANKSKSIQVGISSLINSAKFNQPTVLAAALVAAVVGIYVILRAFASTYPATAPNLFPDPEISSASSWTLAPGTVYDPAVSKNPGSGSIRFSPGTAYPLTPTLNVTPGVEYTLSGYIKSNVWPSGSLGITGWDIAASHYFGDFGFFAASPDKVGEWSEFSMVITSNRSSFKIIVHRDDANSADVYAGAPGDIWLDNLSLTQGVGFHEQPTPKTAFNGTKVKIDSLGNFQWNSGTATSPVWEDWIPNCIHPQWNTDPAQNAGRFRANTAAAWAAYPQAGFNCDMNLGYDASWRAADKANGMRSFSAIAQYMATGGWAYGNTGALSNSLNEIYSSPQADNFAGFYWDNENSPREWGVPKTMTEFIKNYDTIGGKRSRPIIELNGGIANSRNSQYSNGAPFSDVVGAYVSGSTGGAGGIQAALILLDNLQGNERPASYCQQNRMDAYWRSGIYSCIAQGARMFNTFSDANEPGSPVLEQAGGWPDMPVVASELKQLQPFIKAASSASWSLKRSDSTNILNPVSFGIKDFTGQNLAGTQAIGGAVFANQSESSNQNLTYQLTGSPATNGTKVIDYFTNSEITTVNSSGQFSFNIPARGIGAGTRVVIFANSNVVPSTPTPTPPPSTPPVSPANPSSYAPTGAIDDDSTSFAYSSTGWDFYPGPNADLNLYGGGNHTTTQTPTGGIAKLAFTGSGVRLYGVTDTMFGKFDVSIDGGAPQTVDLYSSTRIYNALMFETTGLTSSNHILTLTATGNHNASATDNYVAIDRAEVLAPLATPTPTPVATAQPTISYDLTVQNITWSPASPVAGQGTTFTAVVKNIGTDASPAALQLGLGFTVDANTTNRTWFWNASYPSIPAGGSVTLTASDGPSSNPAWLATAGTHAVVAFVDDLHRLCPTSQGGNCQGFPAELSTANNTLTRQLTATAAPTPQPTPTPIATAAPTPTATPRPTTTPMPTLLQTCTKLGDVNCDGKINNQDLKVVLANYGKQVTSRSQGDLTGDGVVNVFDLSQVLQNWGR